jgi:hypothetical protein
VVLESNLFSCQTAAKRTYARKLDNCSLVYNFGLKQKKAAPPRLQGNPALYFFRMSCQTPKPSLQRVKEIKNESRQLNAAEFSYNLRESACGYGKYKFITKVESDRLVYRNLKKRVD